MRQLIACEFHFQGFELLASFEFAVEYCSEKGLYLTINVEFIIFVTLCGWKKWIICEVKWPSCLISYGHFFSITGIAVNAFVSHQSVVQQYVNFKIVFSLQFQGRNRQSGEQNNSSDKDNKSEGAIHNNNRHHGESGRGRGSREDRWNDRKPGGRGL